MCFLLSSCLLSLPVVYGLLLQLNILFVKGAYIWESICKLLIFKKGYLFEGELQSSVVFISRFTVSKNFTWTYYILNLNCLHIKIFLSKYFLTIIYLIIWWCLCDIIVILYIFWKDLNITADTSGYKIL